MLFCILGVLLAGTRARRTTKRDLLLVEGDLLGARDTTGTAGGDETDLLTRGGVPPDGRSVTDVLVVTTTVRVVHGVHGHTTDLRPAVPLGLVLVVSATGLQHGLVDPSTTGNDANHGAGIGGDGLLGAGRQLDPGHALVGVVRDERGVVARGTGERTTITGAGLDVADDGTLGHRADGKDVTDGKLGCKC